MSKYLRLKLIETQNNAAGRVPFRSGRNDRKRQKITKNIKKYQKRRRDYV
jgi:hypothetical protein